MMKAIVADEPSRRRILAGVTATAAGACSPVGTFNLVAGRDSAARSVAADIAFGAHPRQRLDIYAPSSAKSRAPVVLFIYGGSWNNGSRRDYAFVGSALAARGYVTVIADYRLVPEVLFPVFLDDGALALRWIVANIAEYRGDPDRIAIVGHSAGAYNAAMLALDRGRLRAAGLVPRVVKAFAGLAGPYDFYPWDSDVARAAFGAWPEPAETQPINFASAAAPPTFIATGDADTLVRPRNTTALAARLRAAGAVVEEKIYAGLDHSDMITSVSRLLRSKAPVLDDLVSFLDRRIGPSR